MTSAYFIWCPVLGPIIGAQIGALFYDVFLYNGHDSPVNKTYVFKTSFDPRPYGSFVETMKRSNDWKLVQRWFESVFSLRLVKSSVVLDTRHSCMFLTFEIRK